MGRHKDLGERLDLATGQAVPMVWDREISRAMRERRRQHLANQGGHEATADTAVIQERLAKARRQPRRAAPDDAEPSHNDEEPPGEGRA